MISYLRIWNFVLFNDAWSQKGHSASNTTVILASSSLLRLLLFHIFHLINTKFCSHQNLLIYSIQLLTARDWWEYPVVDGKRLIMVINRKPTDLLLQNWCRNNSWCVPLLWYWNNKVLVSQIYATWPFMQSNYAIHTRSPGSGVKFGLTRIIN